VYPLAAAIGPNGSQPLEMAISLGPHTACTACAASVLSHPEINACNPSIESRARQLTCTLDARGGAGAVAGAPSSTTLPLLPFSYTVVEFRGCTRNAAERRVTSDENST
jgi:hypothetical protein